MTTVSTLTTDAEIYADAIRKRIVRQQAEKEAQKPQEKEPKNSEKEKAAENQNLNLEFGIPFIIKNPKESKEYFMRLDMGRDDRGPHSRILCSTDLGFKGQSIGVRFIEQ